MRIFLSFLVLAPLPSFADTISVPSKATSAIIYGEGAQVTHAVDVDIPAGQHELVFTDLPPGIDLDLLRLSSRDVKIGAVRYRDDYVPPLSDKTTPAIDAAEDLIEDIKSEIEAVKDRARRAELEGEAAADRISFLKALGDNDSLPSTPDDLRNVARMIGEETLAARQAQMDAEVKARDIREELEDLEEDLADAKAALRALVPEPEDKPLLTVSISAAEPIKFANLEVSYFTWAQWRPVYDIRLDTEPAAQVTFDRSFWIYQESGENWDGIDLTLSSETPSAQLDPNELWPDLRRLIDPEAFQQKRVRTLNSLAADSVAEPVVEAPVIVAESAVAAVAAGLGVEYRFSAPVSIANGADNLRIPFDSLTFDAEVKARAVPFFDDTAYLMAKFTNTSAEPLPASDQGARLFEGTLVGQGRTSLITAGEEVEIGFGAIDGLKIERTVINRAEGDRGLINRSNEQVERVRIDLENLTDRTWMVELRDRVPFSEQEDLKITYAADPSPDLEAVDDKRGVLQWNIEMEPGNQASVNTSFKMTWPEGQIVR